MVAMLFRSLEIAAAAKKIFGPDFPAVALPLIKAFAK